MQEKWKEKTAVLVKAILINVVLENGKTNGMESVTNNKEVGKKQIILSIQTKELQIIEVMYHRSPLHLVPFYLSHSHLQQ